MKIYKKQPSTERVGRKYDPEEVFQHFDEPKGYSRQKGRPRVDFDGHLIAVDSHRYWTFIERGLACAHCGIEGQYMYKERHNPDYPYHFNLYAVDDEGHEVLMTKDHIIPRSQGGKNHVDNYQTMCKVCNALKADMGKHVPEEYEIIPVVS